MYHESIPYREENSTFSPTLKLEKNPNINGLVKLTELFPFKICHLEADFICLSKTSEIRLVMCLKCMFRSRNQHFQFLCLPESKQKEKLVIESVVESQKYLSWKWLLSSSTPTANLFPLFFQSFASYVSAQCWKQKPWLWNTDNQPQKAVMFHRKYLHTLSFLAAEEFFWYMWSLLSWLQSWWVMLHFQLWTLSSWLILKFF